ncbi:homocysteine S-methyltransferase family protein [Athalassotoga saccharophila]|uniref:homocysteine S-methyltransferase family protein n=1 Tax=Athalassotoga saccharophila TaxID=1441386 RepID=UPI00137A38D8|nr:homocysteine S-methyltransferase family protein [Athalassotoga saccharophila]BBJ28687.1 methionine synthase [Athalassotoga saccharophila]
MRRNELSEILKDRVLILDGAYGTELMRRGFKESPEEIVLSHPEAIKKLHEEYVNAGSNAILTSTFGANPIKLSKIGLESYHEKIVRDAVRIAKSISKDVLIFGDIGPTGDLPYPLGERTFDEYYDNFQKTASILIEEGVDAIILETFTDILELKAAYMAVRDISKDIFLIAHLTFEKNGRTLTGTDPVNFAITFDDLDVDAIGMNCSLGPEEMLPIFEELSKYTHKLLTVEPDAGAPILKGEKVEYPVTPEEFAIHMDSYWEAGANIIGSCCGSNPLHTRKISTVVGKRGPVDRESKKIFAISGPSSVVNFDKFVVIGERLNPAGKKRLSQAIKDEDVNYLIDQARDQVDHGAHALDVNFGVEQTVSRNFMSKSVAALSYKVNVPLSLDIQTYDFLEFVMKRYPGRPLINSARAVEEEFVKRASLVKKYGGILITLSMGERVPESFEERKKSIEYALEMAERIGLTRDRLIFDPIVLAIGAGSDARETLKTIKYLDSVGLKSVFGLSNISFGMPDRSYINGAFLAMSILNGLSSAIMNPIDEIVMGNMKASLLLTKRSQIEIEKIQGTDELLNFVLTGAEDKLMKAVDDLISVEDPVSIIENHLKPVMDRVGDLYGSGKIFLPQLILAAQTAQKAFEKVQKLIPSGSETGKFVIATVKGDVHDIGKNIVATIVKSAGYRVIDLGRDVPSERIIETVEKENPVMVGLSAMMTTTAPRIKEVVDGMKKKHLNVPVIAGGASLNETLAKDLGADFYAKSATDAIKYLKMVIRT